MDRRSRYRVVKTTKEAVWIEDQNGAVSVTNDVADVVRDVFEQYGDRRILYRDNEGNWDELLHHGPVFDGFASARSLAA